MPDPFASAPVRSLSPTRAFGAVDWAMFVSMAGIWGSSFLFIAIGLESISPGLVTLLRVGLGALTLAVLPGPPMAVDPAGLSIPAAMVLLGGEAVYGTALGLIAAMLFAVVQLSGRIAEQQMGMTLSEIIDPLRGEETGEHWVDLLAL